MSKKAQRNHGITRAKMNETSITTSKWISFMLGSEEETKWINLTQTMDGVAKQVNYEIT